MKSTINANQVKHWSENIVMEKNGNILGNKLTLRIFSTTEQSKFQVERHCPEYVSRVAVVMPGQPSVKLTLNISLQSHDAISHLNMRSLLL